MTGLAAAWVWPVVALACLPLIVAGLRLLRARAGRAPTSGRRLQLQDTIFLDPRRRVHLLSCDGKTVVLLTGGTQDLVVGWLSDQ